MRCRLTAALLGLLICLTLTACGEPEETPAPDVSPETLALAVVESQRDLEGLPALAGQDLADHLSALCGLDDWEAGAVYAAGGMDAREITVVLLADEAAAEAAVDRLEAYRLERQGDFFGYAPEEADRLDRAAVLQRGRWAALLVCDDPESAQAALDACLAGEAPPAEEPSAAPTPEHVEALAPVTPDLTPEPSPTPAVPSPTPAPAGTPGESAPPIVNPGLDVSGFVPFSPPNDADMTRYDTSAIQKAWETGEEGALSEKDAAILTRCREVLGELISEDMTDFEKELAVHDWIVEHGEYDDTVYSNAERVGRSGYQDPYGILVGGYGNCLGYASAFQLLMELCGVECTTVVGASFRSLSDHAWNMVKLDGEWYCVDVTWDDSLSNPEEASPDIVAYYRYRYFNVTSQWMRETDHQWDYLEVPEATAVRYRWDGAGPLPE